MDAGAIAALLKEYGPWGLCALLMLALRLVVGWWRDSMNARIADKDAMVERMAVALERQASTNAEVGENMKEVREGQTEMMRLTSEAAITSAASDRAVNEKLSEIKGAVTRSSGVAA